MNFGKKLVQAVEKKECLYNFRHVNYKNNAIRMKMWSEVAKEVGIKVDLCTTRWKSIRRRYMEIKTKLPSGKSRKTKKRRWELEDLLGFLDPYVENQENETNMCDATEHPLDVKSIKNEEQAGMSYEDVVSPSFFIETHFFSDEDDGGGMPIMSPLRLSLSESTLTPRSSPSLRRKLPQRQQCIQRLLEEQVKPERDEVENFLVSLVSPMRKLNKVDRMEVQIEMQTALLNKMINKK